MYIYMKLAELRGQSFLILQFNEILFSRRFATLPTLQQTLMTASVIGQGHQIM